MKDFSITRIPNNDLIGLLFPPLVSFSEYEIEVVKPEYTDNAYINSDSGAITPHSAGTMACAAVDVSKYDYVLIPCSSDRGGFTSGLNINGIGSPMYGDLRLTIRTISDSLASSYAILRVGIYHYALINVIKTYKLPLIGFRRHRSDNVNPRSPQRPELEPIEIRERQESEPEPMPEIAEPEEDTPEEVEEE